jgi:succinylglutamic semialdehyde dehydrogenase
VGKVLAEHPGIDGLFFTGSYRTGQALSRFYADFPEKILALEMGGNNPLIVSQITDLKAAAYLTIQSAYITSGQRCSCARRLIVPKGKVGEAFIQELIQMIQGIKVGFYQDKPEPFMGPLIDAYAAAKVLTKQKELISLGGISLIESSQLKPGTALLSPGLIDVSSIETVPDDEIFGPFLQLIWVDNFKKAVEMAMNTSYGLVAGLFSDSHSEYVYFYDHMKAGVINWNSPLPGSSSHLPFGGVGHSGNHRPSAYYAADYCAYPVASMESPSLIMPEKLPGLDYVHSRV